MQVLHSSTKMEVPVHYLIQLEHLHFTIYSYYFYFRGKYNTDPRTV